MFLFSAKCPYCKERVKRKAVRCKHCQASINRTEKGFENCEDEGIQYLKNGFSKINAECDTIEDKLKQRTGFVFIKHQYSADDLHDAAGRIESFVDKMRDDLEEWESENKLTAQVKQLFNKKAGDVYHRLEALHFEIERREPTWWEKVCTVFKRIMAKILPFLSLKLIAGKAVPKTIAA